MTPEQQRGLDEYLAAMKAYGEADFGQYTPEAIVSTYGDLQYDPRMRDYEMSALRALEEQGKEGFTARDRAAMAQIEQDVNRQARGRSEAIQQNMQRRGIAGSGADLAARLQSAQSANEIAAMRALEREALGAERRQAGTLGAAQLAGNIGSRDYAAQAQKAAAQQEINRFNAMNRMQAQQYNIGQRQEAAQRRMQAGTGAGQMRYNVATDAQRERLMREEEDRRRRAGLGSAVLGTIGAGIGAFYGKSPEAATAGYGIGSGLGGALGFADGGRVTDYNLELGQYSNPPSQTNLNLGLPQFQNYRDTVPAMLGHDEMVLTKEASQSGDAAKEFVDAYNKAETDLKNAREAQDVYGYADLMARGLSDYAKSQQRNVYLPKSFQQIGTGPDVYRSEIPEFKPGSIAALGERGVQEAEAGFGRAKDKFGNAVAMEKYKEGKSYDDPESDISKRANLVVKAKLSSLANEAKMAGDVNTSNMLRELGSGAKMSANQAMKTLELTKDIDYKSALAAIATASKESKSSEKKDLGEVYDRSIKAKEYVDKLSKDNNEIQNRYQAALDLAKSGSAVDDEALQVYFQKILDPGSVVKESEFARTAEGQAALAQAQSYATKLAKGGLTPALRQNVLNTMAILAKASQKALDERLKSERLSAKKYNLDEEMIFGTPRTAPKTPLESVNEGTILEQDGKKYIIKNGQPVPYEG